jgi:glycosyltransferase involved in cell wall biosynthesis
MKIRYNNVLIQLKKKVLTLLINKHIITLAKNALRRFPSIEDAIGVRIYEIKKILFYSHHKASICPVEISPDTSVPDVLEKGLMVDISWLILRDVHTGIQRVVWGLLQTLMTDRPEGYSVEPVYADLEGRLRYARLFAAKMSGKDTVGIQDAYVQFHPGDVFYCADLHLAYPFAALSNMKRYGVKIIFTVYDIVAMKEGHFSSPAITLAFTDWFSGVMSVADAVVCDSRAVADEVGVWLEGHPDLRNRSLPIGYFHLGADIEGSHPTQGVTGEGAEVLAVCLCGLRPTLLMVGTIEPRKGHAQALAAIESLWKEGIQLNLVIVGKEGWRSHDLVRRLRRHPQRNKQLFWLERASDALLMQLYAQSTALLAASYAEGFGLPLIEAAHYGLPIIARDIPVFHEVAGDFAFYFPNTDSAALADSLRHWLQLHAEGKAPPSKDMPYLTWAQSTQQLLKVILENDWYTTYQPTTPLDTL